MSDKIKVAYIGDSPFIFSGFGVVAKAILSRLPEEQFEVNVLGTMYQHYPSVEQMNTIPALEYYMPVCIHDMMGFKTSIDFLQYANADVLFFLGDPGTLRNRFSTLMLTANLGPSPTVTYFPLEGAPLNPHIMEQAKMVFAPVTYTHWGSQLLGNRGVDSDWAWHGVDHAPFVQYDAAIRQRLRKIVGWDDRFVIGMIGVNKRTNRQPAMLEMAKLLKEHGRKDALVYLHCQAAGDTYMSGWELDWMLDAYNVRDTVWLKPNQREHKLIARPRAGTLEQALELPLPSNEEEARQNLAQLDFISLLNCFDVYMDPASAHGFNLPLAESARCGVPGITVDDGFARTEIYEQAAYMMKPSAADCWHTGAILPLVSPKTMADAICAMWDDRAMRDDLAAKGKHRFDHQTWQPVADLFVRKMLDAADFGKKMASA